MSASHELAVVSRWRLHPGREPAIRESWEQVTRLILAECGGLGSRLHRADDRTFVTPAQWPSREAWALFSARPPVDAAASAVMQDAIAEAFSAMPLGVERNALMRG